MAQKDQAPAAENKASAAAIAAAQEQSRMDEMVEALLGFDLGDEDEVACGSGCHGCRGCGSWR